MNIRKNQAMLSRTERQAFVAAVLALKRLPSRLPPAAGSATRYDDYVWTHLASMKSMTDQAPGWAHEGPAFLPWHRYFIWQFELDLHMIDPSVNLPYWDWTVDGSSDASVAGSPWTDEFMGGTGDPRQQFEVVAGPFNGRSGNWRLTLFDDDDGEPHDSNLRRNLGGNPSATALPTREQVEECLKEIPYYVAPWRAFDHLMPMQGMTAVPTQPSFGNRLEGWYGTGSIHNRVHLWVAGGQDDGTNSGSMYWMSSPNDPIFFLHHANVDRLWGRWQSVHPKETYHPSGLGAEIGPPGHNLNDAMQPWGWPTTPSSVLNHHALGYVYDDERVSVAGFVEESREFRAIILAGPKMPPRTKPIFGLSEEDRKK